MSNNISPLHLYAIITQTGNAERDTLIISNLVARYATSARFWFNACLILTPDSATQLIESLGTLKPTEPNTNILAIECRHWSAGNAPKTLWDWLLAAGEKMGTPIRQSEAAATVQTPIPDLFRKALENEPWLDLP